MTVVTGAGNNLFLWSVFNSIFSVTSSSPTGFNVTGQYGNATSANVAVTGNDFTYSATSLPNGTTAVALTGGTITGVFLGGSSNQSWSGLSVSGVAAFNAIAANDQATFNNLFFGGNDTFNNASGGALSGLGGDDTFNISNGWLNGTIISGGSGNDTLNIAGGDTGVGSLNVTGVERINLGAGYDYRLTFQTNLIDAGNTVTIDGSALGASNHLIMDSTYNISGTFAGNLVVYGGAGDDTFVAGKGSNTFIGGGGTDTVDFTPSQTEPNRLSYNGPGVTANLSISTLQPLGGLTGGSAAFIGIENLIGTPWADTLTGDDGNNVLDGGGGGADVLNGGAGNDTLIARGANSVLNGGAGDDTMFMFNGTADGGSGIDTVVLNANSNSPPYMTITNSNGVITITDVSGDNVTLTNVEYVRFNDRTLSLTGPTVSTINRSATRNETLAVSQLFSVTDFNGSAITKYQLLDTTNDPLSGHFVIDGVAQPAGTVIEITPDQLAAAMFVTGKVNDNLQIRAFDGIAWSAPDNGPWSPFTINVPDSAPVVTTANVASSRNQTLAGSSLFTVSDADGDAITEYQIWDGNDDPLSGHFVLNGVVQAAKTVIDISAAQLAQLSFVTGKAGDTLQIRASDGIVWSAGDSSQWSPFTVSVPDTAPVVTTANLTERGNQTLAASSLFTVSDADGDAITRYQIWDGNADPASGYFVVGGVVQAGRTVIDISAAQLSQVSFVTGSVGDTLQIRAYDGIAWSAGDSASWSPFTIAVPVNHAPVVTTSSQPVSRNQTLAASSLFTVSDADGDAITRYQLWDATADPASGHFVVGGVVQAARTLIDISAAQLAQTSFVTGSVADNLQIRAYDGIVWSAADNASWSPFTLTPTNNAPVVTTSNLTRQAGQTLALSSLFSVSDADGDAITKYQLWDGTTDPGSGYFVVGGVAQAARTLVEITASQLAQTSFVTGSVGDSLQIRASDGTAWSAGDNASWSPFTITIPVNHAPVLTTANLGAQRNQTLAASSLFTVSDADGDAITRYQLWDATADPASGHFVVGGVVQAARTLVDISAAQLAQTSFVTGSVADNLQIRAFDGTAWSAADSASWSPFTLTPANNAPAVTTSNLTRQAGQTLALSSLFTVSDADGDAITKYQLWDGTTDPSSGYFVVGGVAQGARTLVEVTASQLAQTSFVTGSVGDSLQIRASDGTAWSAADNASWSPFTITIPVNHAPVVTTADITTTAGQSLLPASLFTVSDADGDAITEYQIWDGTADPSSGHFVLGGVAQAARTVIDIPASQLGQLSFLTGATGDMLQVRAFDGKSWSAADSAQWSPFHVAVS